MVTEGNTRLYYNARMLTSRCIAVVDGDLPLSQHETDYSAESVIILIHFSLNVTSEVFRHAKHLNLRQITQSSGFSSRFHESSSATIVKSKLASKACSCESRLGAELRLPCLSALWSSYHTRNVRCPNLLNGASVESACQACLTWKPWQVVRFKHWSVWPHSMFNSITLRLHELVHTVTNFIIEWGPTEDGSCRKLYWS